MKTFLAFLSALLAVMASAESNYFLMVYWLAVLVYWLISRKKKGDHHAD